MLTGNIRPTKDMPSEILVDDDDRFAFLSIMVIEEAPFQQRDAHDFEIVRSYGRAQRGWLLVWRQRIRRGPVRHNVLAFAHRNDVCKSDKFNVGQTPGAIEYVPPG